MKKIALIGCGIMGAGMARNFLAKNFDVYIWNRTKENVQSLVDAGAIFVDTPAEATRQADVIFEVTANDASSKAVWLDDDGILSGANDTKSLIISATISAAWVDELTELCASKGLNFFDIPLTGSRAGAENGQLWLLAGGDKAKIDALKEVFSAISSKLLYFGKTGSAMRYKLILNMLQAVHIVGLGEALNIAKEQNLDLETVGQALCERPGGSATNLAWNGYKSDTKHVNFAIELITKDLTYAKELAGQTNTPLLNDVLTQYRNAIEAGKGTSDWSAVIGE